MDKSQKNFQSRKLTLKKKAKELTALSKACEVCMVCYSPNGELEVWPEDPTKAKSIITNYYSRESCMKRQNTKLNLSDVLAKKITKLEHQVSHSNNNNKSNVLRFSNHSLMSLAQCLEAKIQSLDQKIELIKGKQEEILISQNRSVETEFEEHCYNLSPLVDDQELYNLPLVLPQQQHAVSVIIPEEEYDSLCAFDPFTINNGVDVGSSSMIYEDFANHQLVTSSEETFNPTITDDY